MYSKIIVLTLAVTLAFTYASVFAEETEKTITVPFEPVEESCQLIDGDPEHPEYQCNYIGNTNHPPEIKKIQVIQDNLTESEEDTITLPPAWNGDTIRVRPAQPVNNPDNDHQQTTYDILKQILCSHEKRLNPSEKKLCRALDSLSICQQGLLESEPIQKRRDFFISLALPTNEREAWNYANTNVYFVKLSKAQEECRAQWEQLQPNILSPQYLNFVNQVDDFQPYHADMATTNGEYHSQRIAESDYYKVNIQNYQTICGDDSFYSQSTKKQLGCPQTIYNLTKPTMSAWEKEKIVDSDPMSLWRQYMEDPYGFRHEGVSQYVTIKQCKTIVDDNGEAVVSDECNIAIKAGK